MSSKLIKDFEVEFRHGDFQELAACAKPFFVSHWPELREFICRFLPMLGEDQLDLIIKLFILHNNMPFDMGLYMKSQRDYIEKTLVPEALGSTPEARRDAVANWIRENAQKHRQETILKQVLCFDKIKPFILPSIKKALQANTLIFE